MNQSGKKDRVIYFQFLTPTAEIQIIRDNIPKPASRFEAFMS